jgi:gluconate kinase
MDVKLSPELFDNWMPVRIFWRPDGPYVDWCYMQNDRFTKPFFDTTIQGRWKNLFSHLFRHETPADHLRDLHIARPGLPPTGFIFHMSRCGSTLISQMLAALPQNIVISEAPPIDSILRTSTLDPRITDEQRIAWLQGLASALGRKRFPEEKYYFIKFDSWNTLDLDIIRRAFPDVPWIFLYRDPVEVIVSQMRQRGAQMIPGTLSHLLPGLDFAEMAEMSGEEYCARVLERICKSVVEQIEKDGQHALLVNYQQLPAAASSIVMDHFRISYSADDLETMNAAAKFDAKTPQNEFVPDTRAKRAEAGEAVIEAAGRVNLVYERLEKMRTAS